MGSGKEFSKVEKEKGSKFTSAHNTSKVGNDRNHASSHTFYMYIITWWRRAPKQYVQDKRNEVSLGGLAKS